MIIVKCQWCNKPIDGVVYTLTTLNSETLEPIRGIGKNDHLHFDCLPMWVMYMRGEIEKGKRENI